MRLLYAVEFEVARKDGATPLTLGAEVLQHVVWWVTDWYLTRRDIKIELENTAGAFSPVFGHDLELTEISSSIPPVKHTILNWSYPDDNDGNLYWSSRVEIGEFDGRVEVSFQLAFDSSQYLISPVEFSLRRPRLVGLLLKDFRCTCGDMELSLQPREVGVAQVEDFVTNVLCSPTRRLPIVLVSRTVSLENPLIDPNRVSDSLAAIAGTYCLADKWAGFSLRDSIGKIYSCYNGAVRVYWPGFDPALSPFSPIFLPERVVQAGNRLTEDLFRQFAGISAFRYVRGPVTTDAIEHLQRERAKETERLKAAAKESGDWSELLDLASQENEELRKDKRRLTEEVSTLKASLDLAHENFRAISLGQAAGAGSDEASPIVQDAHGFEPNSVEEAVSTARDEFGATLIFLDSALESATSSPFKQPNKVYQALLAMHEVCLSWRDSLRKKLPMGTFESAFEKRGLEYKPRESMTSKGKWGEEYQTTYRNDRVSIEPHLALGKGGPDTCLRIHFYIDEKEQKFVVAHVGRHKTNTRS